MITLVDVGASARGTLMSDNQDQEFDRHGPSVRAECSQPTRHGHTKHFSKAASSSSRRKWIGDDQLLAFVHLEAQADVGVTDVRMTWDPDRISASDDSTSERPVQKTKQCGMACSNCSVAES